MKASAKKILPALAVVIAVVVVVLITYSPKPTPENIAGLYSGNVVYEGDSYSGTIALLSNGTYAKIEYKNGEFFSSYSGDFLIDGSEVLLYTNSNHNEWLSYIYKNKSLQQEGSERKYSRILTEKELYASPEYANLFG